MKGTVKFFNDMKAFGFITGDDGKEYFVHISGMVEGTKLRENDKVTFNVVAGDKGPKADQVKLDNGAAADDAGTEDSGSDEAPADDADEDSEEQN